MNNTAIIKFCIYKLRDLSISANRNIDAIDGTFQDIFGVKDYMRKMKHVYTDAAMIEALKRINLTTLLDLLKNEKYVTILKEMIEMNSRIRKLQKKMKKSGKNRKEYSDEYKYTIKWYRKSVKYFHKQLNISSGAAYKNQFSTLKSLLKEDEYDYDDYRFGDSDDVEDSFSAFLRDYENPKSSKQRRSIDELSFDTTENRKLDKLTSAVINMATSFELFTNKFEMERSQEFRDRAVIAPEIPDITPSTNSSSTQSSQLDAIYKVVLSLKNENEKRKISEENLLENQKAIVSYIKEMERSLYDEDDDDDSIDDGVYDEEDDSSRINPNAVPVSEIIDTINAMGVVEEVDRVLVPDTTPIDVDPNA